MDVLYGIFMDIFTVKRLFCPACVNNKEGNQLYKRYGTILTTGKFFLVTKDVFSLSYILVHK